MLRSSPTRETALIPSPWHHRSVPPASDEGQLHGLPASRACWRPPATSRQNKPDAHDDCDDDPGDADASTAPGLATTLSASAPQHPLPHALIASRPPASDQIQDTSAGTLPMPIVSRHH